MDKSKYIVLYILVGLFMLLMPLFLLEWSISHPMFTLIDLVHIWMFVVYFWVWLLMFVYMIWFHFQEI